MGRSEPRGVAGSGGAEEPTCEPGDAGFRHVLPSSDALPARPPVLILPPVGFLEGTPRGSTTSACDTLGRMTAHCCPGPGTFWASAEDARQPRFRHPCVLRCSCRGQSASSPYGT